ncbi:hypothetical protein BDZ97DRAFT_646769 [Flammula alnicola]|nr:hypothetical protein BDZ97DRAFT_646769 [Flammula alnicola]
MRFNHSSEDSIANSSHSASQKDSRVCLCSLSGYDKYRNFYEMRVCLDVHDMDDSCLILHSGCGCNDILIRYNNSTPPFVRNVRKTWRSNPVPYLSPPVRHIDGSSPQQSNLANISMSPGRSGDDMSQQAVDSWKPS